MAEGEQEEDNGSGDGELAIVDGNDGSKRLQIEREESGLYRKRGQCGQIGQVLLREGRFD